MLIFEKQQTLKVICITMGIILLLVVYGLYNPADYSFFPKCPFYTITGLQCPGCGSQRAVHHILHLDFINAFRANGLLIVSVPYVLLGFAFEYFGWDQRFPKWRQRLFGKKSIWFILVIIFTFFVLRNYFGF